MPIGAVQVRSLGFLGLPSFVMEAPAVYLATLEMTVFSNIQLAVPLATGGAYESPHPAWAEDLIVPGIPWFPGERRVLDFLIGLLPRFVPDGAADPSYQVLISGAPDIVPFAYPVIFQPPGGNPRPGEGLWVKNLSKIFVLRSWLMRHPFTLLLAAYHEGWHAYRPDTTLIGKAREIEPHEKQLVACRGALSWLRSLNATGADQVNRNLFVAELMAMEASLQATLMQLKA